MNSKYLSDRTFQPIFARILRCSISMRFDTMSDPRLSRPLFIASTLEVKEIAGLCQHCTLYLTAPGFDAISFKKLGAVQQDVILSLERLLYATQFKCSPQDNSKILLKPEFTHIWQIAYLTLQDPISLYARLLSIDLLSKHQPLKGVIACAGIFKKYRSPQKFIFLCVFFKWGILEPEKGIFHLLKKKKRDYYRWHCEFQAASQSEMFLSLQCLKVWLKAEERLNQVRL